MDSRVLRRVIVAGIAMLLVASGFFLGQFTKRAVEPSRIGALSAAVLSGPEPGTNDLFQVSRVIDGDTIEIEPSANLSRGGGERVRYIGINAPESVDPRKPVQCFGVEAAKKNRELVEGKQVRLERDINDRDKYGRLLRYVWVGDLFVNFELVREGYATAFTYPPDVKYADRFVKAEQEAREAKHGLWGVCSGADSRGVDSSTMQ